MASWDDSQKFWAETKRTIAFAIAGTIAALVILDPWKFRNDYNAEVEKAKLELRAKVVDEFLTKGYLYTSAAYDTCAGAQKELNGEAITGFEKEQYITAKTAYKGTLYDDFRAARYRMGVYFPPLAETLKSADEKKDELRKCIEKKMKKEEWEGYRRGLKNANAVAATSALEALGLRKNSDFPLIEN